MSAKGAVLLLLSLTGVSPKEKKKRDLNFPSPLLFVCPFKFCQASAEKENIDLTSGRATHLLSPPTTSAAAAFARMSSNGTRSQFWRVRESVRPPQFSSLTSTSPREPAATQPTNRFFFLFLAIFSHGGLVHSRRLLFRLTCEILHVRGGAFRLFGRRLKPQVSLFGFQLKWQFTWKLPKLLCL